MVEGKMSPQLAYYHRKKQDQEFYEKEKIRQNEKTKKKYHTDEEARKRCIENAKQRYYKLKEALKTQ